MSDALQIFKEKQINDYLSSIEMGEMDLNQVKRELKEKLGEEPAIQLNYRKDDMVKEDTGEKIKVEKLESVSIIFTVEREVAPGITAPFPIKKTYIIG